ncbi:transglutaminase family protein [Sporichthya brevicatena]|uniref:transglutaminase family protein n=1 Tax=Sporichthya brevicatena TaxID=171442 RepID=UPI003CD0B297
MLKSREEFAAIVADPAGSLARACLLMACEADPDLDVDAALGRLDALAEIVGAGLPGEARPAALGRHLRATLGGDAGFGGSQADYDDLRSSLLNEVLVRRRGLPILLSTVWVEVSARLDVPAHGIGLPGHFVVGIGDPERAGEPAEGPDAPFVLVDPFAGGTAFPTASAYALLGHEPTARDLRPWDTPRTMLRILANVSTWARRADRLRTRLWALELSLLVPGCPAAVRREHGEALARAGDFAGAADQLEAYAIRVEEDHPLAAKTARQDARVARSRLN